MCSEMRGLGNKILYLAMIDTYKNVDRSHFMTFGFWHTFLPKKTYIDWHLKIFLVPMVLNIRNLVLLRARVTKMWLFGQSWERTTKYFKKIIIPRHMYPPKIHMIMSQQSRSTPKWPKILSQKKQSETTVTYTSTNTTMTKSMTPKWSKIPMQAKPGLHKYTTMSMTMTMAMTSKCTTIMLPKNTLASPTWTPAEPQQW